MKNIMFVGAGALGVMYANHIQSNDPDAKVSFIADTARIDRYTKNGFYCNGVRADFNYLPSGEWNQQRRAYKRQTRIKKCA